MTNLTPSRWQKMTHSVSTYCRDILKLMRLDFYRAIKDRSVQVISIVVAGYALLYILLGYIMGDVFGAMIFTARDAAIASTQLSSMPFLIIAILICIFIGKDLNYGTIRNKIIAGYSKKQIYLSTFLTVWVMTLALLVVFQGIVLAVGSPLITFPTGFPYSGIADFWVRLGLGYLLVSLAVTILVFLEMVTRNMVVALVVGIVVFVLGPVLAMFIAPLIQFLWGSNSFAFEAFECLFLYQSYVVSSGGSLEGIGYYTAVENQLAIKTLISSGVSIILINWLGIYLFHKLDLK